jgi:PPK2 family polyphosphate:nucleotide phosphotransferase
MTIAERYRISPKTAVNLKEWDPDDLSAFKGGKAKAEPQLVKSSARLSGLQGVLYAEHKHKVLMVLQALDCGGKDGTIEHVFKGVNPQGVRVAAFKAPTPIELDHDYLWRVHRQTPGRGEITIFNRSHYEDVLAVRVHDLVPKKVWRRRYQQINNFERMLAEEGVTIVKFYLHISKDEQRKRQRERLKDPRKKWKFNAGDLQDRELWGDYMKAYEEALSETSTDWAPWYVVPANHNWYRNLVVASVLVETLERLKMSYPAPKIDVKKMLEELGGKEE